MLERNPFLWWDKKKGGGGWGNILIYAFATIDGKQTHRLYSSICNKTKL